MIQDKFADAEQLVNSVRLSCQLVRGSSIELSKLAGYSSDSGRGSSVNESLDDPTLESHIKSLHRRMQRIKSGNAKLNVRYLRNEYALDDSCQQKNWYVNEYLLLSFKFFHCYVLEH